MRLTLIHMLSLALLALTGVSVCLPCAHAVEKSMKSAFQVKSDSLRYLQELRVENTKRLSDINDTLRKRVEDGQDLEKEVAQLKATQHEHRMRQDFLDRLINQIDAHFVSGDLRAFLEPTLKEMAKVDAVSSDSGLYVFLRYASEAMQRLPERKENVLSFLENYMSHSVSHPIAPKEFLATRNYTNGSQSEKGRPVARDEVGALADERLQEIAPPPAPVAPPAETITP